MSRPIIEQDVLILAGLAEALKQDYVREGEVDPWAGSPFAWIRTMKSRGVGKIGEQLVAGWCSAKGFDVVSTRDAEADRVIAGNRMEIKFSTLWAGGTYTFQQIRDQNYDYAVCLGISPFTAHCWVIPKQVLLNRLPPQHTGAAGRDTRWLQGLNPDAPPAWLVPYGGTLAEAFEVMRSIASP
jgi:hypothetical protein